MFVCHLKDAEQCIEITQPDQTPCAGRWQCHWVQSTCGVTVLFGVLLTTNECQNLPRLGLPDTVVLTGVKMTVPGGCVCVVWWWSSEPAWRCEKGLVATDEVNCICKMGLRSVSMVGVLWIMVIVWGYVGLIWMLCLLQVYCNLYI